MKRFQLLPYLSFVIWLLFFGFFPLNLYSLKLNKSTDTIPINKNYWAFNKTISQLKLLSDNLTDLPIFRSEWKRIMGSRETACYATCSISYESKVNNTIKVHVPHMVRKIKAKTNITLRKLPEKYGLRQRLMLIKKELPELPIEPYQRAMTFAIEQCLLPTLWHLELVHCMYMSIAPFLRGLIMSYTLQDIIGSAMVTMSYKDEVFAIENCLNSVSMISDDIISAHYKQICQNTASCLSTHPLSNGPYSRFKEEFLARIDQAYSVLPSSIGGVNSKTLARLLLLISLNRMSFKSKTRKVYYPEKLFVSVRAMNTALAVISTIQSLMKLTSIIDQATYIIDTVIVSLSKVEIKEIFMTCRRYLTALEITNLEMNTMLNHMICFEMLSVGFIYENSVPPLTVSIEHFNKSIMPMRMLSEFYPDLIPSYIPGKLSENEDIWLISTIGFTNIEVTSVPQGFIPGLRPTMRNRSRYRAYSRKSKEAVKYDPSYLEPIDTRKKSTVRSIVTKVFLDKIHRAEDRWRTIFKSKRAGISSINKGSSDSEDEVNRKTTIYKQNKILAGFIDNES